MTRDTTDRPQIASPFLDTENAALYLLMSAKTLRNHRTLGTGPAYRRHGGLVVYHRDDLDLWSRTHRLPRHLKDAP